MLINRIMDKYVYLLCDGDIPFYVGKGTHAVGYKDVYRRPDDHLKEATLPVEIQTNKLKCQKINNILSEGKQVIVKIIHDGLSEVEALFTETSLIRKFKRISDGGTLTNLVIEQQSMSETLRTRPVYCFNTDGSLHRSFSSIRAAAREMNIFPGNIVNCCKGRYNTTGGFVWSYSSTFPGYTSRVGWNAAAVDCYDLQGTLIASYNSHQAAEAATSVAQSQISKCCNGKSNTAGGFVWVKHGQPFDRRVNREAGKRQKAVLQYDIKGQLLNTYPSLSAAVSATGITGICRCCLGVTKTAGGFCWRYKE